MKPQLALVGVGICWAFTPVFVVLASWNPYGTIMVRALLTGLALMFFAYIQSSEFKLEVSALRPAFVAGLFGAMSTSTFAVAFLYAEAGKVYVFYYTFPVMLMLWDCLSNKRSLAVFEVITLALAFLGVLVVYGGELRSFRFGAGELLSFGSALFWVVHIIKIRRIEAQTNISVGNAFGQLSIGLLFLPLVISHADCPTASQCFSLSALGAFSFLALYLWGIGVRRVEGHLAGTITMLEAPGGVLLMAFLFRTPLPISLLLGGALVLFAAAMAVRISVCNLRRDV